MGFFFKYSNVVTVVTVVYSVYSIRHNEIISLELDQCIVIAHLTFFDLVILQRTCQVERYTRSRLIIEARNCSAQLELKVLWASPFLFDISNCTQIMLVPVRSGLGVPLGREALGLPLAGRGGRVHGRAPGVSRRRRARGRQLRPDVGTRYKMSFLHYDVTQVFKIMHTSSSTP